MHVADARVGGLPGTGIVGASTLMAIGAALSARQQHTDDGGSTPEGGRTSQIALCFLGDGATNQGMFHEAVNFAAVLNLPAIFLIENNLYGEFTPLSEATQVQQLSRRAAAYGIPGLTVDGNDAWAVYQATREAVERARSGGGPALLECMTYRLRGHTEGEDFEYCTPEEVEEWWKKDPIPRLQEELLTQGVLTEADVARFREEAQRIAAQALEFARESPEPELGSLTEHTYAPEPAQLYQAGPRPSAEPRLRAEATREISFGQAINEALAEEMARDERVCLIGEEVSIGGYFAVTAGLVERFGPQRVIDTPISEYAIVGSAVSAAMTGTRPVAEIMFSSLQQSSALLREQAPLRQHRPGPGGGVLSAYRRGRRQAGRRRRDAGGHRLHGGPGLGDGRRAGGPRDRGGGSGSPYPGRTLPCRMQGGSGGRCWR